MLATGYRYIVKSPGVKGGDAIVEGTRIPVNTVMACVQRGDTPEDIVRNYPLLTRAQIFECMAYYEDHKDEIDALIRINSDLLD